MLAEACRALDELDRLRGLVELEGLSVAGSTGQRKPHPGLAEMRATRDLFGRLVKALALPDVELTGERADRSQRAREAANERWRGVRELEQRRSQRGRSRGSA